MDKDTILQRLNWFYALELAQVDNYTAQSKLAKEPYISRALERFAIIEQQHVDNIAAEIEKYGVAASKTGDILSPYVGKLIGHITPTAGVSKMLKVNIALEQKAKRDYRKFISELDDERLKKILWDNFIDEDLHTSWMISQVHQLDKQKEREELNLH
jgi:bacterioferritin